jgi:hypothetical protein
MATTALVCERYFQMGATEMRAQARQTPRMSRSAGAELPAKGFSPPGVPGDWGFDICPQDL